MIEVSRLTHRFGGALALDDVSFRVETGECVGLLGPNGAGKTTALRIMAGIFAPSAGRVSVDGGREGRVGYVPEGAPVQRDLTAREQLRFVARAKGLPRGSIDAEVDAALSACGLAEHADRLGGALSKGFRQRLCIAQALVGAPPVLLLDEPTSGLDPIQLVDFRELITSLRGERTVVLSSHILPDVARLADRILVLDGGRLLLDEDAGDWALEGATVLEQRFAQAIAGARPARRGIAGERST